MHCDPGCRLKWLVRRLAWWAWLFAAPLVAHGQTSPKTADPAATKAEILVPQVLLGLLHAPEVQRELGFSTREKRTQLEAVLGKVDGDWWRARNLPFADRRRVVLQCERTVRDWLFLHMDRVTLERIDQLELRAQGERALLRRDLADELRVNKTTTQKMITLAATTDAAVAQLEMATREGRETTPLKSVADEARQREPRALLDLLSRAQQVEYHRRLGPDFDTARLSRIYPLAPELVDSPHWINSAPLSLRTLRGRVVILHFYAFECVNCQRNLPIYQQWHNDWSERGVTVLGIQTPETENERQVTAITEAARRDGLTYPVLVDLEAKNWKAWGNTMWPTVYVIDGDGYIRQWWQGEMRWKGARGDEQLTKVIEGLLAERKPRAASP
ncbi:MAG: redoxin domain-containing protein [Planctomycetaceae bacterium]